MRQLAAVAPEFRGDEDHIEIRVDPVSAFKAGVTSVGEAFFSPEFIAEVNAFSGTPEQMQVFIEGILGTYFVPITDDGMLQATHILLMLGTLDPVSRGAQRNNAIDTLQRNLQPIDLDVVDANRPTSRAMSTTNKVILVGAAGLGVILLLRLASK